MTDAIQLHNADCFDVMRNLPESSVDLIVADPPYFKVKAEWWDRQWDSVDGFLAWMGKLCEAWRRVLKPNGSLYVFASPKMAARVEVEIGKWFNVLNLITWKKDGRSRQTCKEELRSFFPDSERIIFAEHHGADNIAKGEAGYEAKCDELRGFVFEPIRAYLDGERKRAGIPHRAVIAHLGMGGHDTHFFSPIQWKLPLPEQYEAMRELFNRKGGEYLRREYEYLRREYEDLRREYEDLRREYEDLRRPFSVSADVPYTDVWDFPTVQHYKGKHPCEKPAALLRHIIRVSSRPGALVLDPFAGSFVLGSVCEEEGRCCIGCEIDPKYFALAQRRIGKTSLFPAVAEAA